MGTPSDPVSRPERSEVRAPDSFLARLRRAIESFVPGPEVLARREAQAVQRACCDLLMEVARLDSADTLRKRAAVARAMQERFDISNEDLLPMIASAGQPERRLTSYYGPVALINKHYTPEQKVQFVEQLWRVAIADGGIDVYEEHLVRKLAQLAYVPHVDFIIAKHRVESGTITAK
jgi:uncharacterized tellurite resistance protein B-like protein